MFAVGYRGVKETGIKLDDLAVVMGLGVIGQGYAQLARLSGARVIGADIIPIRRELASLHSCDMMVDSVGQSLADAVFAEKLDGADIVAEVTGKTELIDEAVKIVRSQGKIVWQGWYPGNVSFYFHAAHRKRVTMVFPWSLEGEADVLRLLAENRLVVEPLITHVFDASDAPKAWDMLLNRPQEALGVVLKWREA